MNAQQENPQVDRAEFMHILNNLPSQKHTQITESVIEILEDLSDEQIEFVMNCKNAVSFLRQAAEKGWDLDDPVVSAMMVFVNKKPKVRPQQVRPQLAHDLGEEIRSEVKDSINKLSRTPHPDLGPGYDSVHPALRAKEAKRRQSED